MLQLARCMYGSPSNSCDFGRDGAVAQGPGPSSLFSGKIVIHLTLVLCVGKIKGSKSVS